MIALELNEMGFGLDWLDVRGQNGCPMTIAPLWKSRSLSFGARNHPYLCFISVRFTQMSHLVIPKDGPSLPSFAATAI
jgi:hypothetical protein